MVNTIGNRATERSLELGLLYSPPEAHKIGLVDQLVPEEKIQSTAAAVMSQWLAIPGKRLPAAGCCCRSLLLSKSSELVARVCWSPGVAQ